MFSDIFGDIFGTRRTRYKCTCPTHGTLYSGYSKSDRDWHSSRPCPYCQNEVNERAARDRAEKLRREEAERLEKIERQKRIEAMQKIERDRKNREAALLRAKKKADDERRQTIENLKQKLKADFNAQKQRFNDHTKGNEDEEKKKYDDLLEEHKLDTLKMVKDIGERVKNCSAAGEEVMKYVNNIKVTLKNSLKDNYKIVEPEVDRYKKYGKEMRDMNDIFVEELGKVLKKEFVHASDKIDDECKEKEDQDKVNNDEYNELLANASNLSMEERIKQFEALAKKADEQKEIFKSDIKQKMESLMDVIDKMESRLNLMDEYYQKMIEDHQFFIDFCINKGKEYSEELANIQTYLEEIGQQVKGRRRDLYEGQGAHVERKSFTVEYEKYDINQSTTEKKVEEMDDYDPEHDDSVLKGMKYGAISGAIVGGVIGCAAGPPGIVGGALIGACIGSGIGAGIGACCGSETYKTTNTTWTKGTGSITLTGADYYDGDKHNNALQQIVESLKGEFAIYLEKLQKRKEEAENQKEETDDFKKSIDEMKEKICTFKSKAEGIMKAIEDDKFDRGEINDNCEELFVDVNLLMDALDEKSKKPEQNWE